MAAHAPAEADHTILLRSCLSLLGVRDCMNREVPVEVEAGVEHPVEDCVSRTLWLSRGIPTQRLVLCRESTLPRELFSWCLEERVE